MADNLKDVELNPETDSKENQIIENVEIENVTSDNTPDENVAIVEDNPGAETHFELVEVPIETILVEPETDNSEKSEAIVSDSPAEPEPVEEPDTEDVPVKSEPVTDAVAEESSVESEPVAEVVTEAVTEDAPAESEPVAEVVTEDVPAESEPVTEAVSTQTQEEISAEKEKKAKEREYHNTKFDAIFEELKLVKENDGTIEVNIIERIRGGLRVKYQDMPMFLPASHFGIKRNPSEQSMKDALGKTMTVHIHELQEDETKRKTVIVSRKKILEDKFWNSLTVGDIVEGPITSIASFGIFVDVYGVEGLVHVTRLSNTRIEDLKLTFKKGQIVKAVIVEVNKDRKRIGLSTKELETSPWKGVSDEIKPGAIVKGTLKRLTDFGAYFEVKPGIDGLVRTSELSWTLRVKSPSEMLTVGQESDLYVVAINEDKRSISLSIKRVTESPWATLTAKYPVKTIVNGTIKQLSPQGAIVNINDEIDGFMPRSKMRFLPKGTANVGETVEVVIDGIDLEKESMIVVPPFEEKPQFKPRDKEKPRGDSRQRPNKESEVPSNVAAGDSSAFTLQDLLSESMKKNLLNG